MQKITQADLKALAKKKGVSKITSLSSAEYREILLAKQNRGSSDSFHFLYDIQKIPGGYKITLKGRHYSNNSINSFSFKRRLAYKKAIHDAAKVFALTHRPFMRVLKTSTSATVYFVFYNPKSRDSDANGMTTKYFQDTLVSLKIIQDDNRSVLTRNTPEDIQTEVLSKIYKAECILKIS